MNMISLVAKAMNLRKSIERSKVMEMFNTQVSSLVLDQTLRFYFGHEMFIESVTASNVNLRELRSSEIVFMAIDMKIS